MNFICWLIFNLVFFGLLFLLLVMFVIVVGMGVGVSKLLQDCIILVIVLEGCLVEQFSVDLVSCVLVKVVGDNGVEEIQLCDLLWVIELVKDDKKIECVVLELDKLQLFGFVLLCEVVVVLQDLCVFGKQLVVYSESMGQLQYLLVVQVDEVYLDLMGLVVFEGLGCYCQYFCIGLQDKLGVDVYLFKVGEYKFVVELYVFDVVLLVFKEVDLFWMNDVWQCYLGDIVKVCCLDLVQLVVGIDILLEGIVVVGGDLVKFVLQQKLVIVLKICEEFEDLMIECGVVDEDVDGGFCNVDFGCYLVLFDVCCNLVDLCLQVVVVVVVGEISGGDLLVGCIGGELILVLLCVVCDDDNVKLVVLWVDLLGGEVFVFEQICCEVVVLQVVGKLVVVLMGDLVVFGGYWISMNVDCIYVDLLIIIGLIGIFGMVLNFSCVLDKIGVYIDGVGIICFVGVFDVICLMDLVVGQVIQMVINKGYVDFIGCVVDVCKKLVEVVDEVVCGCVWSGVQVKECGLVDVFGGLKDVVVDVVSWVKLGKVDVYWVCYIEKVVMLFVQFVSGFVGSCVGVWMLFDLGMVWMMLVCMMFEVDMQLCFVENVVCEKGNGVLVKVFVYCFCGF